ncbi:hypothetical protein T552_03331 [Pneumocystis carinii B80]|uniref:DH domain-containing protein n=1 Tax=Pneumocystis carinii (strain B80) TaxID=1408658 RepID=A0A0W4ZBI2_PNEC8|nr:hypothetical protein T552_03331 [Pneumocystis carinii B80]KTW25719.1 hypothetical protein T552_03331 [Pneumocystis carinii B80]
MTQSRSTKSNISTNASNNFSKYDDLHSSASASSIETINNRNLSSKFVPLPSNSITNKPAIASSSIYQICREIHGRLLNVPNFEIYLNNAKSQNDLFPAGIVNDPVSLLWQCFRQGASLCALYNALRPSKPLAVNSDFYLTSMNACKASVYHFLLACRNELGYKDDDLFSISQLYQDDTNGFVKVTKTVSLILDKLEEKNLLIKRKKIIYNDQDIKKPKDNRAKVVAELLDTERKYVQDMETLQNYMHELQSNEIVSADTIHLLFANLNMLVDFQRRFLIGIEANSALQPEHQRFGALFIQMEESFSIYEPFCSNYTYASDLAIEETSRLNKLAHIVEPTYELPSLLIKPIQRICKYPLLLKELLKYTDPSDPHYEELKQGMYAIKRVTDRVNETRRRQENEVVVMELERKIEDWKGHNVSSFGALLLEDVFIVIKGDVEREYHVYLFERILLCCKEISASKKQAKVMSISKKSHKKRRSLQLKGRIFINSVSNINSFSKNGQYTLHVHWHNGQEEEFFILKCRNEENLKQWYNALKKLIEESKSKDSTQISHNTMNYRYNKIDNQFNAMKNFNIKSKNYATDDSDNESSYKDGRDIIDDSNDIKTSTINKNLSSISVRSRSATNDSITNFGNNCYGTQTCSSRNLSQTSKASQICYQSYSENSKGVSENIDCKSFENNFMIPDSHISITTELSSNHARESVGSSITDSYSFTGFNTQNTSNHDLDQLRYTIPSVSQTSHKNNTPCSLQNYRLPIHPTSIPDMMSKNNMRSISNPIINAFPENQIPVNTSLLSSGSSSHVISNHKTEHNDSTSSISPNTSLSRRTTESPNTTTGNISPSTIPHTRLEGNKNENQVKIKVNYLDDIFVIIVAPTIGYAQLMERVERKIHLCGNYATKNLKQPLRIRYQDEDGDHITINSDEDVQMAVEMRHLYGTEGLSGTQGIVNLYVG